MASVEILRLIKALPVSVMLPSLGQHDANHTQSVRGTSN
jgi:hypothetical protein